MKKEKSQPRIKCSVEKIQYTLEKGKEKKGVISIINDCGGALKGQIYSPMGEIKIDKTFFEGNCEVNYVISPINSNHTMKESYIQIISNGGEIIIPIIIYIKEVLINTNVGSVKDLVEFSEMCKVNWNKAIKIFKSEGFKDIFPKKQPELMQVYENLLKSSNKEQALEEFLQVINKKKPIQYKIEQEKQYELINKARPEKLIVKKVGWGFVDVDIHTDCNFINLYKYKLKINDFNNDQAIIEFNLLPRNMHYGINIGYIYLKTISGEEKAKIIVHKERLVTIQTNKKSYVTQDEGTLIINNPLKRELTVKIEPVDKLIKLQKEKYEINDSIEIPISFKHQQATIGSLFKSNVNNNQLVVKSGLKVSIKSQDESIEKEIPIKIGFHNIINKNTG